MRTIRGIAGLLAVAAMLLATAPVQAQDDLPTVAVLDLNGFIMGQQVDASSAFGKAVAVMMITEMSGRPGMRLVERQDIRTLIEEQALAVSGMVDDDTAIQIGRLLGAQYVVAGGATITGPTLRLDIRMINAETSEIEPVLKLSGPPETMMDIIVRAADQFTEELELVTPSERAAIEEIPMPATLAFSRGMNYADQGRTEEAIEQFEAALEIHPNHRAARRELERLQGGGIDR